jgi:hypothetical protein
MTATNVPEVTSSLFDTLRPAERAVALMALAEAIKTEADKAKAESLTLAEMVGAKSFRTPMGALTITQKQAPVQIKEAALLDWVREHDADLIETLEQVKPWAVKQIADRLVVIEDNVYDSADLPKGAEYIVEDGTVVLTDGTLVEPVPFATVGSIPPAYVSWPSSPEKKAAQAAAQAFVHREHETLAHRVLTSGIEA